MASLESINVRVTINGSPMPPLWRIRLLRIVSRCLGITLEVSA